MEINVRIDLSSPRWLRRVLLLGVPVAAMAITSVAVGVPKQFTAGETLKAADLNANFNDVDARLTTLEQGQITVTEWTSYTPVVTTDGGVTPVIGGMIKGFWRRVGDTMDVSINTTLPTCPAGVEMTWSLPPGVNVDGAKLPQVNGQVGMAIWVNPNSGAIGAGNVLAQSPDPLVAIEVNTTVLTCSTIGTNGNVRLTFSLPIQGWTATN